MGGYGSGRSGSRITKESCLVLDIYYLQRRELLNGHYGVYRWTNTNTGEEIASIALRTDESGQIMVLSYKVRVKGEKREVEETFSLESTPTNFSGRRYWALCPRCWRRCGKLYLPSGGVHFRCRRCYNLTYRSCNESRKEDWCSVLLRRAWERQYGR